jgi:hypothetical protein
MIRKDYLDRAVWIDFGLPCLFLAGNEEAERGRNCDNASCWGKQSLP